MNLTCIQPLAPVGEHHGSFSYNDLLTHETEEKRQLLDVRPPHGVEATRHMTSQLGPLTAKVSRKPIEGFQYLLSLKVTHFVRSGFVDD